MCILHGNEHCIECELRAELAACKKTMNICAARLNKLYDVIPQTYGEAIQIYPWIKCEGHEWDNRTTPENFVWLLECFSAQARDNECRENHYTALCECQAQLAAAKTERDELVKEIERYNTKNSKVPTLSKAPSTPSEGMLFLARWFDAVYGDAGNGTDIVQQDLRRWAGDVDKNTAELARLRLERKPKCYCCGNIIEYGFCDDCITSVDDWPDAEMKELRQERKELRESGEALAVALDRIARSYECGCTPICHCNDNIKTLKIWKDEAMEIARAALDRLRNHANPGSDGPVKSEQTHGYYPNMTCPKCRSNSIRYDSIGWNCRNCDWIGDMLHEGP